MASLIILHLKVLRQGLLFNGGIKHLPMRLEYLAGEPPGSSCFSLSSTG